MFAAFVSMAWLIRNKWMKRRRNKVERKDTSKKIDVAMLTKREVRSQVALHVNRLEKIMQSKLIPLMQMNMRS